MLKRVYVDNFRSFRNFEYRPAQKQLLLGANGAGKTSLLEVIRRLKSFINSEADVFVQASRTRWESIDTQVFELEAALDYRTYVYRLELRYPAEVALERLSVNGKTVFELSGGNVYFYSETREAVAVPLQTRRSALPLSTLSNADVKRFVEWFSHRVHCFDIDAYPGQMDDAADHDEEEPDFEFNNLAGWYRCLVATNPAENVSFIKSLQECMDGFLELKLSSEEDGVRKLRAVFMSPTVKQVSYSISELSQGQRQLITLYMILHFRIARGDTIFIDEPDNFIALREIQPWLLAAEEAVERHDGQLILISHNPESLNLWAKSYGLVFSRERNGQTGPPTKFASGETGLEPAETVARGWE